MNKVLIELVRSGPRYPRTWTNWRWRVTEFHSKKIIVSSSESYKRRIDALKNLMAVTGFYPPWGSIRGRMARYAWIVILGDRQQFESGHMNKVLIAIQRRLTVAASQMQQ